MGICNRRVVYIGGGTCTGKTTLSRALAASFGARAFSSDDRLGDYASAAEAAGSPSVRSESSDGFEAVWMRDPAAQLDEMLGFYRDVFPHVCADVARAVAPLLVAEGIAFLPELLHAAGVPARDCVFLTCERAAHDERYARREWVPLMLEGCTDPALAFALWMARDELFAAHVRQQCARLGYAHISVAPGDSPEHVAAAVAHALGL